MSDLPADRLVGPLLLHPGFEHLRRLRLAVLVFPPQSISAPDLPLQLLSFLPVELAVRSLTLCLPLLCVPLAVFIPTRRFHLQNHVVSLVQRALLFLLSS